MAIQSPHTENVGSSLKAMSKAEQGYEAVFTIDDYRDGPRSGVANFHGAPHFYECIFDEQADDYSNSYLLIPLSQEAFQAAIESWQIFLRWRTAHDLGKASDETHPALPEDKNRDNETKQLLNQAIASGRPNATRATAEFAPVGDHKLLRDVLSPWQVKWLQP
jgi:hypothetical protein